MSVSKQSRHEPIFPHQCLSHATAQGQQAVVTVPKGCPAGSTFRVSLMQRVLVQLPPTSQAGMELVATAPNGLQYMSTVPQGAKPGSRLTISVPNTSSPKELLNVQLPNNVQAGMKMQVLVCALLLLLVRQLCCPPSRPSLPPGRLSNLQFHTMSAQEAPYRLLWSRRKRRSS
jgi:hypothetical protein